jgi:nijmegen breakage syndrome protein 1
MSSQTLRSSPPAPVRTSTEMAPPEPERRGRARRNVTRRFRGFDDEYTGPTNLNSVPESMAVDSTPADELQSQGLFVSQDPEPRMNLDREESQPAESQRGGRKRSTPPMQYEEEDIMEDVAPALLAFKKRKLADDAARRQRGESTPLAPAIKEKSITNVKPRVVKKEIDIQKHLDEQAEKAAELARAEREALYDSMDGMDIEAIRKLAIIEEMEVTRPEAPPLPAAQADESDRWDERWNGRKNFKKFRRRGADASGPRDSYRVIVPLDEVKKKDFGIGEEYWLEGDADTHHKRKKGKGKDTQNISQSQTQAKPSQLKPTPAKAAEISVRESEDEIAHAEEEDMEGNVEASSDVEIVERTPPPQPKLRSQRSQKLADKTNESRNLPAQNKNKRAAAMSLTKPAPAKKAKPMKTTEDGEEDSDDSDGLKFRFQRKK